MYTYTHIYMYPYVHTCVHKYIHVYIYHTNRRPLSPCQPHTLARTFFFSCVRVHGYMRACVVCGVSCTYFTHLHKNNYTHTYEPTHQHTYIPMNPHTNTHTYL